MLLHNYGDEEVVMRNQLARLGKGEFCLRQPKSSLQARDRILIYHASQADSPQRMAALAMQVVCHAIAKSINQLNSAI